MNGSYNWHLEAGSDNNSWTLYRQENGRNVETFHLKRAAGY